MEKFRGVFLFSYHRQPGSKGVGPRTNSVWSAASSLGGIRGATGGGPWNSTRLASIWARQSFTSLV